MPVRELPRSRRRVVIAGAGVAGLEALLAVRAHLGGTVDVELLGPAESFTYRPLAVGEPFERTEAQHFALSRIAQDHEARYRRDAVQSLKGTRPEGYPARRREWAARARGGPSTRPTTP